MTRLLIFLPFAFSLCLWSAAGFAQESEALSPPPAAHPKDLHKTPAPHKGAKSRQSAEEAEKAARLEEGRKKFFERSMGFDNGAASDNPITLQGSGGLTPAMGLKF